MMTNETGDDAAASFAPLRARLTRVAYRMLGSVSDAEDIVQEAFIRWMRADRDEIRTPEAFLRRVVTRLCLDQLKSAQRRRETYVGPWLPEPVVEDDFEHDEDDITLPLMLALERLTPLERAAFLLHDVFGLGFEEIAETVQRSPAACRQLASRARTHIREARPRFHVEKQKGLEIAEAFFSASREGDMTRLGALLAADVSLQADGGGKRPAILKPIQGRELVIRTQSSLAEYFAKNPSQLVRVCFINGLPGFVTMEADDQLQTTVLDIEDDKIVGIYVMRNPDKLRHLH